MERVLTVDTWPSLDKGEELLTPRTWVQIPVCPLGSIAQWLELSAHIRLVVQEALGGWKPTCHPTSSRKVRLRVCGKPSMRRFKSDWTHEVKYASM